MKKEENTRRGMCLEAPLVLRALTLGIDEEQIFVIFLISCFSPSHPHDKFYSSPHAYSLLPLFGITRCPMMMGISCLGDLVP